MDVKAIHKFLSEDSYWAKGIAFGLVNESLDYSFCVGAFANDQQVGFARLITDYCTFGYLADVYVLPAYRSKGISKKILSFIMDQEWNKRLRRQMLSTSDGHGLYRQFGYKELGNPANMMEVHRPDIYLEYNDEVKN